MESSQPYTAQGLRQQILRCLGREYLADVCNALDLIVLDRRSYDSYIQAIEQSGVLIEDILQPLSRDTLKRLCEALDVSSTGRDKEILIDRIVDVIDSEERRVEKEASRTRRGHARPPVTEKAKKSLSPAKNKRTTLFISYSHYDRDWLDLLRVHLKPIERQGAVEIWDDTQIHAGMKWREQIVTAIDCARVAVLLVSPHFLASDFIANNELPPLLESAERDGLLVLPVIVTPCRFSKTPSISKYQAVNDPNKTLQDLSDPDRNRIFVKLTDRIEHHLSGRAK